MSEARHLTYDIDNGALMCRDCKVGICSSISRLHLKQYHPGSNIESELSVVPPGATPVKNFVDFPIPPKGPLLVEGLHIHRAYQCRLCGEVSLSWENIRQKHFPQVHRNSEKVYDTVPAQRWTNTRSKPWRVPGKLDRHGNYHPENGAMTVQPQQQSQPQQSEVQKRTDNGEGVEQPPVEEGSNGDTAVAGVDDQPADVSSSDEDAAMEI